MAESFFDKLKKTVIEGAATAASKAESATRLGKLHLDKMSEERKLQEKEANLGRFVYEVAGSDGLEGLAENADFLAKAGEIRLSHESIARIQTAIETESEKAKASGEEAPAAETATQESTEEAVEAEVVDSETKEA